MKIILGVVAVIVVALIGIAAVPVISVSTWKTDTAIELTDMFATTQTNTDATINFLENLEPTKADIGAEAERAQSTKDELAKTAEGIDDLGPNTVDVTGQYAEAEELKDLIINNLVSLQGVYDEQATVLKDEQKNGSTVKTTTKYAELSEKISVGYTELEQLVARL